MQGLSRHLSFLLNCPQLTVQDLDKISYSYNISTTKCTCRDKKNHFVKSVYCSTFKNSEEELICNAGLSLTFTDFHFTTIMLDNKKQTFPKCSRKTHFVYASLQRHLVVLLYACVSKRDYLTPDTVQQYFHLPICKKG